MKSLFVFIHVLFPRLVVFSALVGVVFGLIALATQKSRKAGFLIFIWSFFGGVIGSIVGFLPTYFLPYQAVAGAMVITWFILLIYSSISGAMVGASIGLKFYHSHSRSR